MSTLTDLQQSIPTATAKATDNYKLLENVAAISADIHADSRLADWCSVDDEDHSFPARMRWCMIAGTALTQMEPADYEEAGLSWYETTETIADGFYLNLRPEAAVKAALNPPEPIGPVVVQVGQLVQQAAAGDDDARRELERQDMERPAPFDASGPADQIW